MRLDDRFTDRQSQAHAAGFCREERLEEFLRHLRVESRSSICNLANNEIGLIDLRFNRQNTRAMFGSGHGVDCVRDQIQKSPAVAALDQSKRTAGAFQ